MIKVTLVQQDGTSHPMMALSGYGIGKFDLFGMPIVIQDGEEVVINVKGPGRVVSIEVQVEEV